MLLLEDSIKKDILIDYYAFTIIEPISKRDRFDKIIELSEQYSISDEDVANTILFEAGDMSDTLLNVGEKLVGDISKSFQSNIPEADLEKAVNNFLRTITDNAIASANAFMKNLRMTPEQAKDFSAKIEPFIKNTMMKSFSEYVRDGLSELSDAGVVMDPKKLMKQTFINLNSKYGKEIANKVALALSNPDAINDETLKKAAEESATILRSANAGQKYNAKQLKTNLDALIDALVKNPVKTEEEKKKEAEERDKQDREDFRNVFAPQKVKVPPKPEDDIEEESKQVRKERIEIMDIDDESRKLAGILQ